MNKHIESIKNWIISRTMREKIVLFFLSLLFIYYIFNFIFIRPALAKKEMLENQISVLKSERETISKQFAMVKNIISSPQFSTLLTQQQQLTEQTKQKKQQIVNFTPVFVTERDFPRLTNDILKKLDPTIILVSLKEFPLQPWTVPEIDRTNIFIQNIYQHRVEIECQGSFFNILAYLTRLETIPWHLYWDNLEYKVLKYPEADVRVQFYVLNNKTST